MIKYGIKRSNNFKKQYKKLVKQGKDISKMEYVIGVLANGDKLDAKYKGCRECHIEPDWLLVYKIVNSELILYLVKTRSYSDLFNM